MRKNYIWPLAVMVCLAGYIMIAVAADQPNLSSAARPDKAKQVAATWFESLMCGDTAVTTALSDVPFALDRKRVIESLSELEKIYEQVVSGKGIRYMRVTDIKIHEDKAEILDDTFPFDRIIVHMKVGNEHVAVCVKPGDAFRVVGFSD